jgi:pyridoxine kinase
MAKVLSISSQVVHGHVGNSIANFVFQRMGHDTLALPTIILSNRPGYKAIGGQRIAPDLLHAMMEAIESNGWLDDIDAIMTGYVPTSDHAALCQRWIETIRAKNSGVLYLCDPIVGDEEAGIYVEESAAAAVRDRLLPLCDLATPNCFELKWLTGLAVAATEDAAHAAAALSRPAVIVTSAPGDASDRLANVLLEGGRATATLSPKRNVRAHGTGDFFASMVLASVLKGSATPAALQAAAAAIDLVLEETGDREELQLIASQDRWACASPPLAGLHAVARAEVPQ